MMAGMLLSWGTIPTGWGPLGSAPQGCAPGQGIHLHPLPGSTDPQGEAGKRGPPAFQ